MLPRKKKIIYLIDSKTYFIRFRYKTTKFYSVKKKHNFISKNRPKKKFKNKLLIKNSSNKNTVKFSKKGNRINLDRRQQCCKCLFITSRMKLLRRHSVIKHWENKFLVDSRKSSFHLQMERTFFNCSYCPHIETDLKNLLKHVELTHLEKKDYRKSEIDLIKEHLKEIYDSIHILNQETNESERLSANRNIQVKPLLSYSREFPVTDLDNYQKIEKIEYNNNVMSNINTDCNKKTPNEKQRVNRIYKKHIIIHCFKCAKPFTSKYTLNQHEVSCTGLKMTHFCQKCKREFHLQNSSESSTNISSVNMCRACKADCFKHSLSDSTRTYSSVCKTSSKIEDVPEKLTKTSSDCHIKIIGGVKVKKISPSPECNATLGCKKSSNKHKRSKYMETFCSVCKKKFRTIEDFEQHMQSDIHETMTYLCSICSRVFSKFKDSEKHRRTGHRRMNILCPVCNDSFQSRYDLDCHFQRTRHNTITSSSVPGEKYEKVNKIGQIERKVYKKGSVLCLVCRTLFSSKTMLEEHIKNTGHDSSVNSVCSVCSAFFKTKDALDKHITSSKHKNKTFLCTKCMKEFVAEIDLKAHMNSSAHKRNNENSLKQQSSMFSTINTLKPPINSTEDKSVKILGSLCRKSFLSNNAVGQHVNRTEHKVMPVSNSVPVKKQQIRSQSFQNKVRESNIITKDSSEQPIADPRQNSSTFVCLLCDASFTSNRSLYQHMNSTTHKKKLTCSVCQKKFAKTFDLKQHMASNVHG